MMHLVILCHPGKSFLFEIRDCAVAMKSGKRIGFLLDLPGVKDQSLVEGSWRSVPCRGLDIVDGRYRTHLASLTSHEMVGNCCDGSGGLVGSTVGLD